MLSIKNGIVCLTVGGLLLGSAAPAEARIVVKKYRNCKAMNHDYEGGIAINRYVENKGKETKHKPVHSKSIYNANKKLDKDGDRIACER